MANPSAEFAANGAGGVIRIIAQNGERGARLYAGSGGRSGRLRICRAVLYRYESKSKNIFGREALYHLLNFTAAKNLFNDHLVYKPAAEGLFVVRNCIQLSLRPMSSSLRQCTAGGFRKSS